MSRRPTRINHKSVTALFVALLALTPSTLRGAATVLIVNMDPAGVGFNDPTSAAPVGGNAGTTLGQQRLIAFQTAASIWGATLTSVPTITVAAKWAAMPCTATTAVLGQGSAAKTFANFPGATRANRWYPSALANKLANTDLDPATFDINATFNINLGNTGCLTGTSFYLGVDNNHGSNVDLVSVVLHELAHGLGFETYTDGATGAQKDGMASLWDDFLFDTNTGLSWANMTDAQRAASAINNGKLVWTGASVTSKVPLVLQAGGASLKVTSPASVAGTYSIGTASFGPPLNVTGVTAEVMPVVDTAPNLGLACAPLSPLNAAAVNGKIAVVDRGGACAFTEKVKHAQNAGAVGVIVINNVAGSTPQGMGGSDPTITIPSVQITQADGAALKTALATRSRTRSGMFATLSVTLGVYPGTDAVGRALMYAPTTFQSALSISHWDPSMFPNQLMEPPIPGGLTHSVVTPFDLTFALLQDIGW